MSWFGAAVLVLAGVLGLGAAWNAARPIGDPTRRYSPWWLPAMVVIELAPLWIAVYAGVLALGISVGGHRHAVGVVGLVAVAATLVLLAWVRARTMIGVRRLRRAVTGGVLPATAAARWLGRPAPTPPGVGERRDVAWGESVTADLTLPPEGAASGDVLVYVHGGGWTGGDPQRQARDLYHALAIAGWTVVAVRYPFTPHVTVEHQIETIRNAVTWARGLVSGSSDRRVVLAGGSAGAHLAAMAALTPQHESHAVDACIGIYGVYDMANRNRTRAHWHKIRNEVMLESVAEAPERYRAVSPIDQELADSPPFLLIHGTHDTLVPFGEALQMAEVLRAAGRDVELVAVYGAQHAFDALSGITNRTVAAVIRDWLGGQAPTA